ncbi:PilZ domain-containing protein [Candidatus Magnetominusculus xianensis]|uniref:Pilus assembly protein PilZ domain protein n=1 Tax=Candidatus Magnetominusculus xianensis TaxID=1748249 RepID=A0ABR5SDP7_9BACT|nr:PilZ domain-containing protein [Candidatus Magnetominusculus xianensis]KWT83446.1 pilus assembly protein PilZ domain protein [Candidatus Magnetominusculus xianensis]MBF0405090.1 PilZ domain-containing protein [Nitrospirota bacterium]
MERRRYQRADVFVQLGVRILPLEKQSAYFSEISAAAAASDISMKGESNDADIYPEFLTELQEKTASMVKVLDSAASVEAGDGFHDLPYKQINLSGSGVRFLCDNKCSVKDIVELRMVLPLQPPMPICIYGDVVRVLESDDGYGAAAEFIAASDEIRHDIAQFISALLDCS